MVFIDQLKNKEFNLKNEVLSGLTVSLALVPEAVAFSLMAEVSPLVGLYSAFIIGLITAVLGGRPGMISGATGAIAVVIVSLVVQHGIEYLFAAVVLMGAIQILIGVLRLGKFIRLVPQAVMYGFVNGLAAVIFMSQFKQFQYEAADGAMHWLTGTPLLIMLGFVLLTMAIIHFLPKLTKAIPASLAAILVVSGIIISLGIPTKTVGDIASISGGLPSFHIPDIPFNLETLMIVFPYSLIMALVGLIESLLTLTVVDEMTETRGRGNKESVAQGIANTVCGFFGGMGGCAMIGQSIINVSSGGRNRISGIVAAVALLLFVLVGASLIEQVPMAALVGLMFMVAIGTFEWASLRMFKNVPHTDFIVMITVALVTIIFHNLAVAVLIGVVISALKFAWENALRIRARKRIDEDGVKHYEIYGPLFFGSVGLFQEKFKIEEDPDEVIIDFEESRVVDHSAIEALNKVTERYAKVGKKVHLKHLSSDCRDMLDNASAIIDVNYWEDPKYKLVSDELA
ncbi:SulP family inorganic anion transporter [Fodinibius halophilus]|uniref:SulP family inorganic anion transporter n=1 Tax=Fodinibius halophilus TaxID=1736908 RepID=A0A6M1T7J3_9BACT|nr:SulP family inorganic anion transporter [Fodinibius halophilus]NGP87094.1 SulP family inorganic anion transporter [Fodinibius halophilus]